MLGSYTPKQRMEAIAAAEAQLDREGHKPSIRLRPNQIKIKPELFQPRTITYGLRPTEDSHVQVLMQAIRAGETPPQPVVIKLKDEGYVVVDGHHTVAAYKGASGGFITVVLTDFEVHPIHHTRHAVNEPIFSPG
jgi:hypothetical protein